MAESEGGAVLLELVGSSEKSAEESAVREATPHSRRGSTSSPRPASARHSSILTNSPVCVDLLTT